MKYFTLSIAMVALVMSGCTASNEIKQELLVSKENVGKEVTVEGKAIDRKGGAVVMNSNVEVWIDGLSSWPEGYYSGGDKGKQVKVKGLLAEDNKLPVFTPEENGEIVQGIPIEKGMDIVKASHRFVLKDAKWEIITD